MISAFVAALGLVQENTPVIIGAMVIAPLLGPNMALALGTTLGKFTLVRNALITNVAGASSALLFSVVLGFILSVDPTTSEIANRTKVELVDILLALASGVAGAMAVTSRVSAALVGVIVAVALLPPLLTCGLLISIGEWRLAAMAALLTAINVISVNLAAVFTFFMKNIKPREYWNVQEASSMSLRAIALWCVLLVTLALLIWFSNS